MGRWLYWTCAASGDPAASGVVDRTTRRVIDVPAGGELGDGYVVLHDEGAGRLQLVDFHTGDGTTTRTLADITGYLARGYYAVDRFGGGVAYVPGAGSPARCTRPARACRPRRSPRSRPAPRRPST
ncbi:hypothetical protein DN402_16950 [Streptomyces sp. SW4]|nr:hypothetical protein DN402_16950 [Streptomyces sp. SW4]